MMTDSSKEILLEIEQRYDVDDLMAFNKYYLKTDKLVRRHIRRSQIIGIVLLVGISLMSIGSQVNWKFSFYPKDQMMSMLIAFVIVAAIWIVLVPWIVKVSSISRYKKTINLPQNQRMLGQRKLIFTKEGVYSETDDMNSQAAWTTITPHENKDYYLLYLSTMQALLIRKSDLDGKQKNRLEALLKEYCPMGIIR